HGRKSRFLKVFGHRVGLDDVEQLLARGGIEAVCAGADDALVIYTTDADAIDRIRDIVRDSTSISPKGIKITQIASIPRNDAGKVRYAALNELT
ncbi:MAG: AMP-dependent synthetase, partial [Gammaproteobacteria bacterium]|nr:AMP-dependent synthetase [Gammaproteobacteria bacterium]